MSFREMPVCLCMRPSRSQRGDDKKCKRHPLSHWPEMDVTWFALGNIYFSLLLLLLLPLLLFPPGPIYPFFTLNLKTLSAWGHTPRCYIFTNLRRNDTFVKSQKKKRHERNAEAPTFLNTFWLCCFPYIFPWYLFFILQTQHIKPAAKARTAISLKNKRHKIWHWAVIPSITIINNSNTEGCFVTIYLWKFRALRQVYGQQRVLMLTFHKSHRHVSYMHIIVLKNNALTVFPQKFPKS